MSQPHPHETALRDLLTDRVADLATADLAGPAWAASRAVRRRRRAGVTGVLAAVVAAAVVTAPSLLARRDGLGPVIPALGSSEAPTTSATSGYQLFQVPVGGNGPSLEDEARAPVRASPLPPVLEVGDEQGAAPRSPASVAVGQVLGSAGASWRVSVLTQGAWYAVDTSRLSPYDGDAPLVDQMLSPDGRRLVFPQPGALAIYDLLDRSWTDVATHQDDPGSVRWEGAGALSLVAVPATADHDEQRRTYSPGGGGDEELHAAGSVQADMTSPIFLQSGPGLLLEQGPEVPSGSVTIEAEDEDRFFSLTFERFADPTRPGSCCLAIGWLDHDHALYLSRGDVPRLMAWAPTTGLISRVTELRGLGADGNRVGFADLRR